jgi:hypothetical protein
VQAATIKRCSVWRPVVTIHRFRPGTLNAPIAGRIGGGLPVIEATTFIDDGGAPTARARPRFADTLPELAEDLFADTKSQDGLTGFAIRSGTKVPSGPLQTSPTR